MFGATGFSAAPFGASSATGPVGVSGVAATGGVGSVSINGDADALSPAFRLPPPTAFLYLTSQ